MQLQYVSALMTKLMQAINALDKQNPRLYIYIFF